MQFNFYKNICKNFLKNGYRPVYGSFESEAITENSKYIAFSKITGATLYTVFLVRTDLLPSYKKTITDYVAKISSHITVSDYDEMGNEFSFTFNNKIFLSLLITENEDEELKEFSTISDIIGNEYFIELRWIANISEEKLKVYGEQPKKLKGIENIVNSSFNGVYNGGATTLSQEYAKIAAEKRKNVVSPTTYGTFSMIALLILISLTQFLFDILSSSTTIESLGMLYPSAVLENGEYYRLFTCIFLHGGISHLASNCLSLYIFGTRVERYFGSAYYMAVYILSGLISSVATTFLSAPEIPSLGASGAIFGLEGAVLAHILIKKDTVDGFDLNLILLFSVLGISFGFLMSGINNIAHISGFLSGLVISLIYLTITMQKEKKNVK